MSLRGREHFPVSLLKEISLKALVATILPKAGMNNGEFKRLTDCQPGYLLLKTWDKLR